MNEELRRAIAAGAPRATLRVGATTIELVRIPAGELDLGAPASEAGRRDHEGPARRVRIARPYYLGVHEVTQAQYRAVVGEPPQQPRGDDLPVSQISYRDALEFCRRASRMSGVEVTLPTEAQWEHACRAGTTTRYWSGDGEADLARVGWYSENAGQRAHRVGEKPPNPWGLYDMHGNVWEYCADYIEDFGRLDAVDPIGRISEQHGAMRGGGWMHGADESRSASRMISNDMFGGGGLRIAVALPP